MKFAIREQIGIIGSLSGSAQIPVATKARALEHSIKPDSDGWITLHVTELVFPPWCCDCGAPTLERHPFRVQHMTGFADVLVPVCETCRTAFRQKYRRAFWKPLLWSICIVALMGFGMGAIPALTGRDPQSFPILSILCAGGLAVITLPIAWIIVKRRTLNKVPPPVEFRRYVRKDSVTFRYRRPEFTTEFVEYLEAAARSKAR